MHKRHSGFTLMELLIAVGLMVLLITAIVVVFFRSTDVVKIGQARIDIYENARAALDFIGSDIQNTLPPDGGQQRAWLQDFQRLATSDAPVGSNIDGAMDYLGLVTVATAPVGSGRELRTVYVEYFLMNDDDAETSLDGGGSTTALRSKRNIHVLKRRLWGVPTAASLTALTAQQKAGVPLFTPMPAPASLKAGAGSPPTLVLLEEADLCHWVLSLNVEAYWDDTPSDPNGPGKYGELDDAAPMPYVVGVMPLGDQPSDPVLPRKFRITLRVIEGAGERQERVFQREIWTPLGG